MQSGSFVRNMLVGAGSGLAATILMDAAGIGALLAFGARDANPFALIGDTASGALRLVGVTLAGGTVTGAVCHYLIGPGLGCIWSQAAARFATLRSASLVRAALPGVVFTELVSLPLLAMSPPILHMTISQTLTWFGMAAVMHLVYGACLGAFVSRGLRAAHPGRTDPLNRASR